MRSHPLKYTPDTPDEPRTPWVQPGLVSAFGRRLDGQVAPRYSGKPYAPFLDTRPPADRS